MHLAGIHANQYPGCIPQGCIYMCIGHWVNCIWLVSVSCPDCVCLPPFSLRGWDLGMRLGGMDLLGTSSFKGASLLFLWYTLDQESCCREYTLSVDLMYMYKEMPASLHTGVWEDFCLLDKYSHWTTISMTDRTPCIPLCT